MLVAFTEFSRPRNKTRNKPVKTIAVITLCSVIGALSRYMLSVKMEMPLTVSAIAATCIMLTVIYFSRMYMPPVGAITMLAMIIPEESISLYPAQILVGSCLIVFLSRILFMKRQDKKMYDKEHELKAI
ncbi:MAG: HPP family protein [Lachnospiraceae bacterium]|nr:HPP family protein [Lachnospiraceae bacterium]